jgi:hypothetical protein
MLVLHLNAHWKIRMMSCDVTGTYVDPEVEMICELELNGVDLDEVKDEELV